MAKNKTYTFKLSKEASRKRRELMRSSVKLDNGIIQIPNVAKLDRDIVKIMSRFANHVIDNAYKEISKKSEVS